MRILICIDHWGLIGGSERYAAAIAGAMVARGHSIRVLAGAASGDSLADVPFDVVPTYSQKGGPTAEVRATALREDFDVVLVLSIRSTGVFKSLLGLGRPLARFVQDHTVFCPSLNKVHEDGSNCQHSIGLECLKRYYLKDGCMGFKKKLHRTPLRAGVEGLVKHMRGLALARKSDALIVASQYMRGELELAGFDPARITVLPYFTDSAGTPPPEGSLPRELQKRLDRPDLPLVLTPARLVLPDKGVDYLLTALTKVRSPFQAVIAGSGPAEEYLREKAGADGLGEKAYFTGWMGEKAIEALYSRAKVVVFPSVWNEPFGLVGLEAMAHSVPVVAFGVGGVPEWLSDQVNGLLVQRGDTDRMAGAIDELLADPVRAASLGAAGKQIRLTRLSREVHVDGLEKLLSSLIAKPTAASA